MFIRTNLSVGGSKPITFMLLKGQTVHRAGSVTRGPVHLPSVRQVLGGGAAPGDAPRGRYVVCGDRVPQKEEDVCVFNGLQGTWLFGLQGRKP